MRSLEEIAQEQIQTGKEIERMLSKNRSLHNAVVAVKHYLSDKHYCAGNDEDPEHCQACWIQEKLNQGLSGDLDQ